MDILSCLSCNMLGSEGVVIAQANMKAWWLMYDLVVEHFYKLKLVNYSFFFLLMFNNTLLTETQPNILMLTNSHTHMPPN